MTMVYFLPLLDITGICPVLSEDIFPLIGNILITTMFARTPTSSGMGFGSVITLGIILGVIIILVDQRFFCS